MATIGETNLTLLDITKRADPNGMPAAIAELLNQTNEAIQDIPWVETNKDTSHVVTSRTSLPATYWRKLNEPIAVSKSTTGQHEEGTGMLEAYSEIDVDVAATNGNSAAWRMSENMAFAEALGQEFAQTLFYGNTGTAPEEFHGLSNRYNSLSGNISQNVITGSGAGSDNSSVWLICWKKGAIYGIYPRGTTAGLQHEDMGVQLIQGTAGLGGTKMKAYVDHFQWKCGLVVQDWRYAVRIPNIDISNLVAKSSAADLTELMIKAIHRLPTAAFSGGKLSFYMNRTCLQMLDIQRRDDVISGGGLTYENVDGRIIPHFRKIPIRLMDQLLETEAAVS